MTKAERAWYKAEQEQRSSHMKLLNAAHNGVWATEKRPGEEGRYELFLPFGGRNA
jgi:hypothetical protein